MAAYSPFSILATSPSPVVVGNSATNQVISIPFKKIDTGDARDMWIIAEVSTVSGGAGVIKMQQCHRADGVYVDVAGATVTITAAGVFKIEWNTTESGSALLPYIRIVSTTGAGDALQVDRLYKTERNDQ